MGCRDQGSLVAVCKAPSALAGRLRLSASGRMPIARAPCSPWLYTTSLAPRRSRDGSEDQGLRLRRAQCANQRVRRADGNPRAQPAAECPDGRAARGLPGSRRAAQRTSGAQALGADHEHPANRPPSKSRTTAAGSTSRNRVLRRPFSRKAYAGRHAEAAPPLGGDVAASVSGEGVVYFLLVAVPSASVRRCEICAILPERPVEETARTLRWPLRSARRLLPSASFTFSVFETPGARL
jgi:hypothetical protein